MNLAAVYFFSYFMLYVAPLIGSLLAVWLLRKTVFKSIRYGTYIAVALVAILSSIPWAIDGINLLRSRSFYKKYEITDMSSVQPGTLLLLQEPNYGGATYHRNIDFAQLPFVTEVAFGNHFETEIRNGKERPIDLWRYVKNPNRSKPFPYDYVYISIWQYAVNLRNIADRQWPTDGRAVHMLVKAPENGVLVLSDAEVLFRRFNQHIGSYSYPLFWGVSEYTKITPNTDTIFDDLIHAANRANG